MEVKRALLHSPMLLTISIFSSFGSDTGLCLYMGFISLPWGWSNEMGTKRESVHTEIKLKGAPHSFSIFFLNCNVIIYLSFIKISLFKIQAIEKYGRRKISFKIPTQKYIEWCSPIVNDTFSGCTQRGRRLDQ